MAKFKYKHNKKRNAAIAYNILVSEFIESSANNNKESANSAIEIIKEYYAANTPLMTELSLYNVLIEAYSNEDINTDRDASRLIDNTRMSHNLIDRKILESQKSKLIATMNRTFGKDIWNRYSIANYKNLAMVSQILDESVDPYERVLIENKYIKGVMDNADVASLVILEDVGVVSNAAYKEFKREYSEHLIEENMELLDRYIKSYKDGGLGYRVYLNSEVGRVKTALKEYAKTNDVTTDEKMYSLVETFLGKIEEFKSGYDEEELTAFVLAAQQVVKEIQE